MSTLTHWPWRSPQRVSNSHHEPFKDNPHTVHLLSENIKTFNKIAQSCKTMLIAQEENVKLITSSLVATSYSSRPIGVESGSFLAVVYSLGDLLHQQINTSGIVEA